MSYDSDLNFIFQAPTKVVYGQGALSELPMEVGELGSRVLLITDQGLMDTGLVDDVKKILGGSLAGVFADVPQDTGMEVVDKAAEYGRSVGADVVVSFGGGSVMDTAKGVCIGLKGGGSMRDHEGMQMLTEPQTPHITIPTTAGTGSEVTPAAVILDHEAGQKMLIMEKHITPNTAILDPVTNAKMPPGLTASTGMDAMTHAVEGYVAGQRNPISDGLCLWAVKMIAENLPRAVDNGNDLMARGQMQIAALVAGWGFANSMLGLVHAMAHSLGAVCRVPHGLANGILLPHVMQYNLSEIPELSADLAGALSVDKRGMPPAEAGQAAVEFMHGFIKRIGLPARLAEVGVQAADLDACSELSMTDGSIVYNPRMVLEAEEVLEVYKKAY